MKVKINRETRDVIVRKNTIKSQKKWHEFKSRKAIAIDKYLKLKRRSVALEKLMKQFFIHKAINLSLIAFREKKEERAMRHACAYIAFKMYLRCGRP